MGGLQCLISLFPHLVRRPEANWTLTPKYGQVAVTTGVCSGPLPTNYYHLTTGLECSTNDVGIYYAYEITDLKGYLESYEVSWVQLVQIDWLENFSEPPLGTAARGGWYSAEKHTKGLDTRFPANTWGQEPKLWDHDTPRSGLWTSRKFEWRKDQFEAYLLWQAKRRPSIPVPLKMAKWDWQGKARRYTANQPPQWGLIGGSSWPTIVPKAAIGINVYSPPEWTNNVRKVPYQHNTFWFTEP
jgi:hypothetical protein